MKRVVFVLAMLLASGLQADEIHWAARKNQVGTVKKLLKDNPNLVHVRELRSKRTPLHMAAEYGCMEVARLLVESRANVNAQTEEEGTPLQVAAAHGQSELAQLLIAHGAIADAFTYAALGQTEKMLQAADLNATDKRGNTLLHLATQGGHSNTVRKLLIQKVDVAALNQEKAAPLELAVTSGNLDITKLLLAGGADPQHTSVTGKNMLHLAPTPALATVFLAFDVSPTEVDDNGSTPLHAAIGHGDQDLVRLLIKFGAKADAEDNAGQTPLHAAARHDHAPIASLLIEQGADVNAQTATGDTPLHLCTASKAHPKSIPALLIKHGAKINTLNDDRQTPLDVEEAAIKQWIGLGMDETFMKNLHATANLYIKHGGKNGAAVSK